MASIPLDTPNACFLQIRFRFSHWLHESYTSIQNYRCMTCRHRQSATCCKEVGFQHTSHVTAGSRRATAISQLYFRDLSCKKDMLPVYGFAWNTWSLGFTDICHRPNGSRLDPLGLSVWYCIKYHEALNVHPSPYEARALALPDRKHQREQCVRIAVWPSSRLEFPQLHSRALLCPAAPSHSSVQAMHGIDADLCTARHAFQDIFTSRQSFVTHSHPENQGMPMIDFSFGWKHWTF